MFDALKVRTPSGVVFPQLPQRPKDEPHDPSVDLVGMLGGSGIAYALRHSYSPRALALVGGALWGASYVAGRTLFGEPHDYFGRENAPSNLSYGVLAIVGGFGSTWALTGAWHWLIARR